MIRISTIFIAICMVLVAASLGLVLHAVAGFSGTESAIALTALTFLILYNAVSMRLRLPDVGGRSPTFRGTADRPPGRRIRLPARRDRGWCRRIRSSDRIKPSRRDQRARRLVKQLAISVASHEDQLAAGAAAAPPVPPDRPHSEPPEPPASVPEQAAPTVRAAPAPAAKPAPSAVAAEAASPSRSQPQLLAAVKNAVEESRLDIYLQPMVTLPQRKVRFYEAVTRLRDDKDQILAADDFIATAEAGGLIGKIDHMVMLRCIQVLRRLMVRNKDVGVFCNVSAATLGNPANFAQCLDFLEDNRALAPSFVLVAGGVPSPWSDRKRISPRCRSAVIASRSIMSRICGSNRGNSPTVASASSRCRRRCCSIPSRTRPPISTPPIYPTCSAASAST
jgi:cyclic-di-GMP phosphodiesterase TipF (flagellum assembly factor)